MEKFDNIDVFARAILAHGNNISIKIMKNGIATNLVHPCTKVETLLVTSAKNDLGSYLKDIFQRLDIDRMEIIAKKSNGSSLKEPKEFVYEHQANNLAGIHTPAPQPQAQTTYHQPTQQSGSDSVEFLKLQLSFVKEENAKLKSEAEKNSSLKEDNQKLRNELYLLGTKSELDARMKEYETKNSLGSVVDKVLPMVESYFTKKQPEPSALGSVPLDSKLGILLKSFENYTGEPLDIFFEINLRMGKLMDEPEKFREMMDFIRVQTESFNSDYNQYAKLKQR